MEFQIDRDPLLKALSRVQTVVERRNTLPILGNALLEAREGGLSISATDLEVSLRTVCAAEVIQPGGLTVSARILFEIVRELPEGQPVRLCQIGGDRLRLTCGRARFDLAGLPVEQFPEIPNPEGEISYTIEHAMLAEMLTKTHFAMSYDETRFTLNGVFLQLTPPDGPEGTGRIRLVATDTHRMAMVEKAKSWTDAAAELVEVIIPKKAVHEIRKLLEEDAQDLQLVIGDNYIQFMLPEITLISKLVDGRFPDYRRVIPSGNNLRLDVPREELHGVVRRMSVLSNEKSRGIRLVIDGDLMKISTTNPENDVGEEELAVTFSGDAPLAIGFNARYLRDILGVMDGEVVRFTLRNEESPSLVFNPEQEEALFVLMPMRV